MNYVDRDIIDREQLRKLGERMCRESSKLPRYNLVKVKQSKPKACNPCTCTHCNRKF